jgi:DNA-binding NtrC family response regulator
VVEQKSKQVFIIDDDVKYLNILQHMFITRTKFQVRTYDDGFKALEDFWTYKPDILILDNDMPKITGIEIVKILYKNTPTTKIVVVSSNFSAISVFQALGIKDFLPKPFSIKDLLYIISK